nr:hypothetical protein GCM10020093_025860 [Planobispora longispora]
MPVERVLPTPEAHDLLDLVRDLIGKEVAPRAAADESAGRFPREVFATLGAAGLLGLPYPEEHGGAAQPYEVYLQVIEELAAGWLAVGLGLSVHTLSCFPVAAYGTDAQRESLLPAMLGGGCWAPTACRSRTGSDAAALTTKAVRDADGYAVDGVKAWITHGGAADFYTLMARTSADGARGISCFHVPAGADGLSFGEPERKMGMKSSPTAQVRFDGVRLAPDALIGAEEGFRIAMAALDGGGSASPPAPSAWPRPPSTPPPPTPRSAASSAPASSTSRASASCWPTWPPRSPPRAPSTSTPPAPATRGGRTARRRRWPSCSPPTCA